MTAARNYGDVLVLPAVSGSPLQGGTGARHLAIACDSIGAIGPKPGDAVRVSGTVVGRFACRVPLMELLALGAEPVAVITCLCVEPEPAGREILDGVRAELEAAGVANQVALIGSSEKNVPTMSTGVGLSVLGWLDQPRWGLARAGDLVLAVGQPRVGGEVSLEDSRLADVPTLRLVLEHPDAGDVVPVGSRGAGAEAGDLARRSGCIFRPRRDAGEAFDLKASAGPSTCFLVTCHPAKVEVILRHLAGRGRPVTTIGSLEAGDR